MWKKRSESMAGWTKIVNFHDTGNPKENSAAYFLSTPGNEKILRIAWLGLTSEGIGRSRTYLSHLAEVITQEQPSKIEWIEHIGRTGHSNLNVYMPLGNENEWPGIGFSISQSKNQIRYSIAHPLVFKSLIKQKLKRGD